MFNNNFLEGKRLSEGTQIADWYEINGRDLPWRKTRDPYSIWISEIIFQQTRIEQGTSYYLRFIKRFPEVTSLAKADLEEVLKYWEGLGYYSRARNLHHTAKFISGELNGIFPDNFLDLEKLKGIGPYTSRAISSIAFNENVGVVDGNVLRVIARYTAQSLPINDSKFKKEAQKTMDLWVKKNNASSVNQGIMDIGAMVCTPSNPSCQKCPLASGCKAFNQDLTHYYPIKVKKAKKPVRYYLFFLIRTNADEFFVQKRPEKGLLGGLWEIPNNEVPQAEWEIPTLESNATVLGEDRHIFTHFEMKMKIIEIRSEIKKDGKWVKSSEFHKFAFSKGILKIFDAFINFDD